MTDGNTYEINKRLNSEEDWDALQEVTAELEQAEVWINELEAQVEGANSIIAAERAEVLALRRKLTKAREEGFWAGRSCGGAKKEIDAALAELSKERSNEKGQDDAE